LTAQINTEKGAIKDMAYLPFHISMQISDINSFLIDKNYFDNYMTVAPEIAREAPMVCKGLDL
jgi:hypothetical protein